MVPIGFPETSVRNYHYELRNTPEERITPRRKTEIKHSSLKSHFACTSSVVQLTHIDFFYGDFLVAFLHILYVSHKLNLLMLSSRLS